MKNLKRGLLATGIILVSAGSAFATNMAKQEKSTLVPGFRYDPSQPVEKCIESPIECSTTVGDVCTWSDGVNTHQLYEFVNGTMCGIPLYKAN